MFGKKNPYYFIMKLAYLLLTATSKQWPLCFPLPVSVVERFDSISVNYGKKNDMGVFIRDSFHE
uniref:Uncharacterized protein n=1 Tax=Rhodnius prolixus TaxID=13249 RepID=T1HU82_RHOPR